VGIEEDAAFERVMICKRLVELIRDDSGQDLVEYALISTIVAAGTFVVLLVVVALMGIQYNNWLAQTQTIWEPGGPCGC
jgi:hypothetical protein